MCVVPDPIRGGDNVLVMCDVLDAQGVPHETNTRAKVGRAGVSRRGWGQEGGWGDAQGVPHETTTRAK